MARYTKKHIDRCVESATYQTGNLRLDREAGIVSGVKVLGWSGKGGKRVYKRHAVEAALPHYDGVVVNLNHVKVDNPDRSVTERFGRIINPVVKDDGLYADLKYNRRHWWAETFTGWVEDDPGAIGLSHDAILQGPTGQDGKRNIESIPKVFSVDIVADPGSTKGLHEDDSPEADIDASQDMDDLDDGGDDSVEHLCSFIVSILKDESMSLDERKAKVVAAMKLMDDDEKPEPEEKTEEPKEKPEMEKTNDKESLTPDERAELDALRLEKQIRAQESKAREKCKIADLDERLVTDVFIDTLTRSQESKWESLIADRKALISTKPVSSGPGDAKKVTTEDLEKFLLGETK